MLKDTRKWRSLALCFPFQSSPRPHKAQARVPVSTPTLDIDTIWKVILRLLLKSDFHILQFFISENCLWMSLPFPRTAVYWLSKGISEGSVVVYFPAPGEVLSPGNNPARPCGSQQAGSRRGASTERKSAPCPFFPFPLGLSQAFFSHSWPFPPR